MNDIGPERFTFEAGGRLETHRPRSTSEPVAPTPKVRLPLQCVALAKIGKTRIPPRPWAYGTFLLLRQAACLGAVDGGGKGSMAVAIMLSMIFGVALLGERVWRRGPVAIVTYEDDQDEWHQRIAAACDHYELDYDTALDNIRFIVRPRERIVFAAMQNDRAIFPDGDDIIAVSRDMGAVLLIVDPLNHAHGFDDGNNNVLMAKVAAELNRIADEGNVAALVLHHLRKGSRGQPDDLMGATSVRATFRINRILARMTADEAKALGLEREGWRYSRIAGSKENYSPPPDQATWFRLASVSLGNGTDEYPDGDSIQVTTAWQPPSPFAGIDADALVSIFAAIRTGLPEGEWHSPHRKAAKRWVGQVIMKAADKTADQAATIVKHWTENGVLSEDKYRSRGRREEVDRVVLDETKATAILAPMQRFIFRGDE